MTNHNPHARQLFTLEQVNDSRPYSPLVQDTYNNLHGISIADDEDDESDESDNEN